jgi:hypothetical protein
MQWNFWPGWTTIFHEIMNPIGYATKKNAFKPSPETV